MEQQEQQEQLCGHCGRKAFRTPTNRCMYCGKPLPESLKLSDEELAAFRQKHHVVSEESQNFASGMHKGDFELHPEPLKRPKRKKGMIRRMGAWLLETLSGTRNS